MDPSTSILADAARRYALAELDAAAVAGHVSPGAVVNIRRWLTDPCYAEYAAEVARHITEHQWETLDDVFWTVIPFGTGGRRGRMYTIGSNAINRRTIGESAQGLAAYVQKVKPDGPWSCAIGYDTRHRSREFAELSASILVAAGFQVYFLHGFRSTPALSFLVRQRHCDCGIMVTASHNPPTDNAVKVYWSTGGQLVPPHDAGVIAEVTNVTAIAAADFAPAVSDGRIILCQEETDSALVAAQLESSFGGPRDVKIIYSPLHGVGERAVCGLLHAAGFEHLAVYERHRTPDGDFPNVPGHVANPENAAVFDEIVAEARQVGANVVLATDPDCDRMGAAAPLTPATDGPWRVLDGNQLGALLADYVLEQLAARKRLTPQHYVVTTLVTTLMICRIARSYGVQCCNDNLVGFKWIGDVIDRRGPDQFVFGAEESHGYLVGTYARDKDGAVAAMLMAELAARCHHQGITLHQRLDQLYCQHGYHAERLVTVSLPGSDGMRRAHALMTAVRGDGLTTLGGWPIVARRDYLSGQRRLANGVSQPLVGPTGDLVILDLEADGNYVAVRPSGTEPKIKMYLFGYVPPQALGDLAQARQETSKRLDQMVRDVKELTNRIA